VPTRRRRELAVTAAVFDCDGTLVETRDCWRAAYEAVFGEPVSDEVMSRLRGASTRIAAQRLGEIFGREVKPEAIEQALVEAAHELEPLEGVEDLLRYLRSQIPCAVATNGPGALIDAVLGERLRPFFEVVVRSEEFEPPRDKPEPDVYLEACERLGAEPAEAVAFEDADIGARSALSAGLKLVFVNARLDRAPAELHPQPLFVKSLGDPRVYAFLGA
jgi:HAD superfamily hydrolase (TIGR01509 family)